MYNLVCYAPVKISLESTSLVFSEFNLLLEVFVCPQEIKLKNSKKTNKKYVFLNDIEIINKIELRIINCKTYYCCKTV